MTARTPLSVRRTRYAALVVAGALLVVMGTALMWPALALILAGMVLGAFGLVSYGLLLREGRE